MSKDFESLGRQNDRGTGEHDFHRKHLVVRTARRRELIHQARERQIIGFYAECDVAPCTGNASLVANARCAQERQNCRKVPGVLRPIEPVHIRELCPVNQDQSVLTCRTSGSKHGEGWPELVVWKPSGAQCRISGGNTLAFFASCHSCTSLGQHCMTPELHRMQACRFCRLASLARRRNELLQVIKVFDLVRQRASIQGRAQGNYMQRPR